MRFLEIIAITLMTGCIGAGLVWFGWGFVENVAALVRGGREESVPIEDELAEPVE